MGGHDCGDMKISRAHSRTWRSDTKIDAGMWWLSEQKQWQEWVRDVLGGLEVFWDGLASI